VGDEEVDTRELARVVRHDVEHAGLDDDVVEDGVPCTHSVSTSPQTYKMY
jgi:hypothetical protein